MHSTPPLPSSPPLHPRCNGTSTVPPRSPTLPHSQVLKDIPLYVVTEEKLGLLGTREQAIRIAQEIAMERTIAS